jgi:hypothetical protein
VRLASEIVAAMQQLAVEQRRLVGLRAPWHVGSGFAETDTASLLLARGLATPPERPLLPEGFTYRTVGSVDIAERVAIHREVWTFPDRPSRVTESSDAQVRARWPYRESLDRVVEAPDGRFAAYCLCQLDAENRVEPVGVRPRVPKAWSWRGRLHVRARTASRGGRAAGDRRLRVRSGAGPL